MRSIKPLLFSISMGTNVLANLPSHLYKRIRIPIKVLMLKLWLIKYQQQIPIRAIMPITTSSRPVEIQQTTFG